MSLMQLLAVGRSIRSIRDQRSPYKMTQQNLLPRFGTGQSTERNAPPASPNARSAPVRAGRRGWKALIPWARWKRKTDMNTEVVEPSSETLAPPAAYPRGRWTMLSNPFHRKPAAKRAEAPVQGELALDMVKVVRNDLSEADLEIVPGRPPEPAPSEPVLTAGTAETDGVLWNRIASRFFGSRET